MEARSLQSDLGGDADHFLERGVEENADQRDLRGQRVADRLPLRARDAAPARGREDPPDLVGAFVCAEERIGHGAHAAELDLHACTSLRVALCGSAADESASPTSSIDAPSARKRRASSGVWTPLSATSGAISRASGATRANVYGCTSSVLRLRAFTPSRSGSHALAASSSLSPCTSTRTAIPGPRASGRG